MGDPKGSSCFSNPYLNPSLMALERGQVCLSLRAAPSLCIESLRYPPTPAQCNVLIHSNAVRAGVPFLQVTCSGGHSGLDVRPVAPDFE